MTLVVLVILAVLWAVVLVPPLLRSRTQHTADSIGDFNYKLDVLGRTNGNLEGVDGPVPEFTASHRAARRRREVLRGLTLSIAATLLLAYTSRSGAVWALQIFVDLLMVAYLGLWAWARGLQVEQAAKVRYLPARQPREPELALRRSASS